MSSSSPNVNGVSYNCGKCDVAVTGEINTGVCWNLSCSRNICKTCHVCMTFPLCKNLKCHQQFYQQQFVICGHCEQHYHQEFSDSCEKCNLFLCADCMGDDEPGVCLPNSMGTPYINMQRKEDMGNMSIEHFVRRPNSITPSTMHSERPGVIKRCLAEVCVDIYDYSDIWDLVLEYDVAPFDVSTT
jgi:hypothetical protein